MPSCPESLGHNALPIWRLEETESLLGILNLTKPLGWRVAGSECADGRDPTLPRKTQGQLWETWISFLSSPPFSSPTTGRNHPLVRRREQIRQYISFSLWQCSVIEEIRCSLHPHQGRVLHSEGDKRGRKIKEQLMAIFSLSSPV